jgi:cephalosporin hydroxylase
VTFNAVLQEMLATRRVVGETGRVFEGLVPLSTENNLRALQALMREVDGKRTMEIGLCHGGSALVLAEGGDHTAIDPHQADTWDNTGLISLRRAGLSVDFRATRSEHELPRMLAAGESFDLIYVDGSHLVEDVFVDAFYAVRLLRPRGVIAFDDSTNAHVRKVLAFMRRTLPGLQPVDLSRFRSDALRYRIARALGKTQMTAFRRVGEVRRAWDSVFIPF